MWLGPNFDVVVNVFVFGGIVFETRCVSDGIVWCVPNSDVVVFVLYFGSIVFDTLCV